MPLPTTMTPTEILAWFDGARDCEKAWDEAAEAIERLELAGAADETGATWISKVTQVSGWTANQLRQMQRVRTGVENVLKDHPDINRAALLACPYSHLEIITRLSKISPAEGTGMMRAAAAGDLPIYRALKARYDALRSGENGLVTAKSAGHVQRQRMKESCSSALQDARTLRAVVGAAASAPVRIMPWPRGFDYASPTFIAFERGGRGIRVHAIECISFSTSVHAPVLTALRAAGFESSFFDSYTLILGETSPGQVEEACGRLNDLALSNVGLSVLTDEHVRVVLRPCGPPSPDRRQMLRGSWPEIAQFEQDSGRGLGGKRVTSGETEDASGLDDAHMSGMTP